MGVFSQKRVAKHSRRKMHFVFRAMVTPETSVSSALHLGNSNCHIYFDLHKDDSGFHDQVGADSGSFLHAVRKVFQK